MDTTLDVGSHVLFAGQVLDHLIRLICQLGVRRYSESACAELVALRRPLWHEHYVVIVSGHARPDQTSDHEAVRREHCQFAVAEEVGKLPEVRWRRRDFFLPRQILKELKCFDVAGVICHRFRPVDAAFAPLRRLVVRIERLPQPVAPLELGLLKDVAVLDEYPGNKPTPMPVGPAKTVYVVAQLVYSLCCCQEVILRPVRLGWLYTGLLEQLGVIENDGWPPQEWHVIQLTVVHHGLDKLRGHIVEVLLPEGFVSLDTLVERLDKLLTGEELQAFRTDFDQVDVLPARQHGRNLAEELIPFRTGYAQKFDVDSRVGCLEALAEVLERLGAVGSAE